MLDITCWVCSQVKCSLCMCSQEGFLTLENEKYVVWQGPVSSLNCPAILILEFQSMGNESSIALPSWGGGEIGRGHLPPAQILSVLYFQLSEDFTTKVEMNWKHNLIKYEILFIEYYSVPLYTNKNIYFVFRIQTIL